MWLFQLNGQSGSENNLLPPSSGRVDNLLGSSSHYLFSRSAPVPRLTTQCDAVLQKNLDQLKEHIQRIQEGSIDGGPENDLDYPVNENNMNALLLAADQGMLDFVQVLVEARADVNHVSRSGASALLYSVNKGHDDCVQYLIKANANMTPNQSMAPSSPIHLAAKKGYDKIVRMLVQAGSPLHLVDSLDHTPLVEAIHNKHLKIAQYLLEYALQEKKKREDDESYASKTPQGHNPVQMLNLDQQGAMGTALTLSLERQAFGIVSKLLEAKSDPSVCKRDGISPLVIAIHNERPVIVKDLIKAGANISHMILSTSNTQMHGMTALKFAANRRNDYIMRLLIDDGADVNQTVPTTKFTALHHIAKDFQEASQKHLQSPRKAFEHQAKLLKILVENGGDPEMQSQNGERVWDMVQHFPWVTDMVRRARKIWQSREKKRHREQSAMASPAPSRGSGSKRKNKRKNKKKGRRASNDADDSRSVTAEVNADYDVENPPERDDDEQDQSRPAPGAPSLPALANGTSKGKKRRRRRKKAQDPGDLVAQAESMEQQLMAEADREARQKERQSNRKAKDAQRKEEERQRRLFLERQAAQRREDEERRKREQRRDKGGGLQQPRATVLPAPSYGVPSDAFIAPTAQILNSTDEMGDGWETMTNQKKKRRDRDNGQGKRAKNRQKGGKRKSKEEQRTRKQATKAAPPGLSRQAEKHGSPPGVTSNGTGGRVVASPPAEAKPQKPPLSASPPLVTPGPGALSFAERLKAGKRKPPQRSMPPLPAKPPMASGGLLPPMQPPKPEAPQPWPKPAEAPGLSRASEPQANRPPRAQFLPPPAATRLPPQPAQPQSAQRQPQSKGDTGPPTGPSKPPKPSARRPPQAQSRPADPGGPGSGRPLAGLAVPPGISRPKAEFPPPRSQPSGHTPPRRGPFQHGVPAVPSLPSGAPTPLAKAWAPPNRRRQPPALVHPVSGAPAGIPAAEPPPNQPQPGQPQGAVPPVPHGIDTGRARVRAASPDSRAEGQVEREGASAPEHPPSPGSSVLVEEDDEDTDQDHLGAAASAPLPAARTQKLPRTQKPQPQPNQPEPAQRVQQGRPQAISVGAAPPGVAKPPQQPMRPTPGHQPMHQPKPGARPTPNGPNPQFSMQSIQRQKNRAKQLGQQRASPRRAPMQPGGKPPPQAQQAYQPIVYPTGQMPPGQVPIMYSGHFPPNMQAVSPVNTMQHLPPPQFGQPPFYPQVGFGIPNMMAHGVQQFRQPSLNANAPTFSPRNNNDVQVQGQQVFPYPADMSQFSGYAVPAGMPVQYAQHAVPQFPNQPIPVTMGQMGNVQYNQQGQIVYPGPVYMINGQPQLIPQPAQVMQPPSNQPVARGQQIVPQPQQHIISSNPQPPPSQLNPRMDSTSNSTQYPAKHTPHQGQFRNKAMATQDKMHQQKFPRQPIQNRSSRASPHLTSSTQSAETQGAPGFSGQVRRPPALPAPAAKVSVPHQPAPAVQQPTASPAPKQPPGPQVGPNPPQRVAEPSSSASAAPIGIPAPQTASTAEHSPRQQLLPGQQTVRTPAKAPQTRTVKHGLSPPLPQSFGLQPGPASKPTGEAGTRSETATPSKKLRGPPGFARPPQPANSPGPKALQPARAGSPPKAPVSAQLPASPPPAAATPERETTRPPQPAQKPAVMATPPHPPRPSATSPAPTPAPKSTWANLSKRKGPTRPAQRVAQPVAMPVSPPRSAPSVFPRTPQPNHDRRNKYFWEIVFIPNSLTYKKFQAKIVGKNGALHKQHIKNFGCQISCKDPSKVSREEKPSYNWQGHPQAWSVLVTSDREKSVSAAIEHLCNLMNEVMKENGKQSWSTLDFHQPPPRGGRRAGPPGGGLVQRGPPSRAPANTASPTPPDRKPPASSGTPSPAKRTSAGYSGIVKSMVARKDEQRKQASATRRQQIQQHAHNVQFFTLPAQRRRSSAVEVCRFCNESGCSGQPGDCWFRAPDQG